MDKTTKTNEAASHFGPMDVRRCPFCNSDWTKEGSIVIECNVGGIILPFPTKLDEYGMLKDIDSLVLNGYHSHTLCTKCSTNVEAENGIE